MKQCKQCNEFKNLNNFCKNKYKKDGYNIYCKFCTQNQYNKNKEKYLKTKKKYYIKNKDIICNKVKNYQKDNLELIQKYRIKNRKKNCARQVIYEMNRLKTDIKYKIKHHLRDRLRKAIKGNYKSGSAVSDLGCSIEKLKLWMEMHFQDGMNWTNYGKGGWVIDHIRPLSSFDLSDRKQFLEACHFSNMQPMWEKENLEKGDKLQWTKH